MLTQTRGDVSRDPIRFAFRVLKPFEPARPRRLLDAARLSSYFELPRITTVPNRSSFVHSALATILLTGAASVSAQQSEPSSSRIVWPDEGARTWTPRPTEAAITPNDLRTRLYQIAADSMEGRKIGSRGDVTLTPSKAAAFRKADWNIDRDHCR